MAKKTVDDLLAEARAKLDRVGPEEAKAAVDAGDALIVDIRMEAQRAADGVVPGAAYVHRNVIEWRVDPETDYADPALASGRRIIVMCDAGYTSSLVAATLQELGLEDATDLAGGFQAWRGAELPVEPLARSS
ncbi:MAG TPA: rhodanese-like domain-containing protein [Thermoleophilaceae bacterium]|jgi:rhodanese-related sulfurtransferase